MPNVARLGDKVFCPDDSHSCKGCLHPVSGGSASISMGSKNVKANDINVICVGHSGRHGSCCGSNTFQHTQGSNNVLVNNQPICRQSDKTTHCGSNSGKIVGACSPNVRANS